DTALAHQRLFRDVTVDGEGDAEFGAFAGMAADEGGCGCLEDGQCAAQDLHQVVLHAARLGVGQGDEGKRIVRCRAHGVDVVQGVVGGNTAEHPRVVDECAEAVHTVHHE